MPSRSSTGPTCRISVVMPVYNAAAYLDRVITALEDQTYDRSLYEIVLIDNNSTDDSLAIAKRYPSVTLLQEAKQGSYSARNRGILASSGDIIAFTDSDCVISPDWLSRINAAFADPTLGILLGRRNPSTASRPVHMLNEYANERDIFIFNGTDPALYYGFTNNMAVRRELFRDNLFVERYRGSDATFVSHYVHNTSTDGVRYDPDLQVTHLELTSIYSICRKVFIYGRSNERLAKATAWRSLTMQERLEVYRRTVRRRRYSPFGALQLFALLGSGVVFWHLGSAAAKLPGRP